MLLLILIGRRQESIRERFERIAGTDLAAVR
jgi:hypothetical protein